MRRTGWVYDPVLGTEWRVMSKVGGVQLPPAPLLILACSEDYGYFMVGDPSRQSLRVYCRSWELRDDFVLSLQHEARALGFDVGRWATIPQEEPVSDLSPCPSALSTNLSMVSSGSSPTHSATHTAHTATLSGPASTSGLAKAWVGRTRTSSTREQRDGTASARPRSQRSSRENMGTTSVDLNTARQPAHECMVPSSTLWPPYPYRPTPNPTNPVAWSADLGTGGPQGAPTHPGSQRLGLPG